MKTNKISLLQAKPTLMLLAALQAYFIWLFIGQNLPAYRSIAVPIFIDEREDVHTLPSYATIMVRGPRRLLKQVELIKPFVHAGSQDSGIIELSPEMVIITEPFECVHIIPATVNVHNNTAAAA